MPYKDREVRLAYQRNKRAKAKYNGVCQRCFKVNVTGEFTVCRGCRDAQDAERYSAVDRGLCRDCRDNPVQDDLGTLCTDCLARRPEREKERALAGQCKHCDDPRVAGPYCEDHWFDSIAKRHRYRGTGPELHGHDLKDLFYAQNGRCAYTFVPLRIGGRSKTSASLDHKCPKSKGGTNALENLHWVAHAVNSAKGVVPHETYLELVKVGRDLMVASLTEYNQQQPVVSEWIDGKVILRGPGNTRTTTAA